MDIVRGAGSSCSVGKQRGPIEPHYTGENTRHVITVSHVAAIRPDHHGACHVTDSDHVTCIYATIVYIYSVYII